MEITPSDEAVPVGQEHLAEPATAAPAPASVQPPVQPTAQPIAKEPSDAKSEWRDLGMFLLKLAAIVFFVRSFIFSPFVIPSESMLPRLLIGDYLFITKWNYGYSRHSLPWSLPLIPGRVFGGTPTRGDVVVFKAPPTDNTDWIKRVIGLPGDTVQMVGGQLVVNGKAVPKQKIADFTLPITPNFDKCQAQFLSSDAGQPVCRIPRFRETLDNGKTYDVLDQGMKLQDDTQIFTVPAGHVFLMGDNRDNSTDSRFSHEEGGIEFVPLENLEGKAVVNFWSTDGSANWFLPWTWFTAARWSRIGEGFLSESLRLRGTSPLPSRPPTEYPEMGGREGEQAGAALPKQTLAGWISKTFGEKAVDLAAFERALTHGSQAAANYERLEFLGDRVLGLVIAEWLYERFGNEAEGALSRRLNALVTGAMCAGVAREIGVVPYLRLGKQARDDGAADSDNVLGDVMEALIGALYLQSGIGPVRAFIRKAWETRIEEHAQAPQHPKSALQEWAAANNRKPPEYEITDRSGPNHAPKFVVTVRIPKLAEASAEGTSKSAAETTAAAALLEKLAR